MGKVYVDTREKLILPFDDIEMLKLDVADYTTPILLNKCHGERKSPADFYGSLFSGHTRFRNMFLRAMENNIKVRVFVECPEYVFLNKKFPGGSKLKATSSQLYKMIKTMQEKYCFEVVYCKNREDMMEKMQNWFENEEKLIKSILL